MNLNQKRIDFFWSNIDINMDNRCWNWTGSISSKSGYGKMFVDYNTYSSHRISWFLRYGEIPDGLCVLHHCDNKLCCNPDHLFLGTNHENSIDMVNKSRQAMGEDNGQSKLSDLEVIRIRELYKNAGCNQRELARMFNISKGTIYYIVNDIRWRHLI